MVRTVANPVTPQKGRYPARTVVPFLFLLAFLVASLIFLLVVLLIVRVVVLRRFLFLGIDYHLVALFYWSLFVLVLSISAANAEEGDNHCR